MLTTVLAMLYPFLAHVAVTRHSDSLTALSLACLALAGVLPGILAGRIAAWVWAAVLGCAISTLFYAHVAGLPLYAPPIVIDSGLAWIFGSTLRGGSVPLIERLVRLLHDPEEKLSDAIFGYARRLTIAWTVLFCTLALVDLLLALCIVPGGFLDLAGVPPPFKVTPETWSLFANFLGYLIVAGFFVLEYHYRRRRFPQQPYRNIVDFARRAARVGPQAFR